MADPGPGGSGREYRSAATDSLGPWLIRPTAVQRKHHRHTSQVLLLFPPPGYSGRARLGVIDSQRRQEFTATWHQGRLATIPRDLHPDLDRFFARLLPEGSPSGVPGGDGRLDPSATKGAVPTDVRWPALAAAGLASPASGARAPVDLLLEAQPHHAEGEQFSPPLTGRIIVPPIPGDARIYLAAILHHTTGTDAAGLLRAALDAARHNRSLRLALTETWSPTILELGLEGPVRDLHQAGRLELLRTGGQQVAATKLLHLPYPSRIGLLDRPELLAHVSRGALSDAPPRLRAVLLLPGQESVVEAPDAVDPGMPGRLATPEGDLLLRPLRPAPPISPLGKMLESYAVSLFDRILAQTPSPIARAGQQIPRALGFCPLFLDDTEDWKELGQAVRKWNRRNVSPQILSITPSDYCSTMEQLHAEGRVRLPRR